MNDTCAKIKETATARRRSAWLHSISISRNHRKQRRFLPELWSAAVSSSTSRSTSAKQDVGLLRASLACRSCCGRSGRHSRAPLVAAASGRVPRRRSAGFQTCCIADFQVGSTVAFGWPADLEIQIENLRYDEWCFRPLVYSSDPAFIAGLRALAFWILNLQTMKRYPVYLVMLFLLFGTTPHIAGATAEVKNLSINGDI